MVLRKVQFQVISLDECRKYYGSRVGESQMCTMGAKKPNDVCTNDSGGPIFIETNGLVYLAGIVSMGSGCGAGNPGVATRVSKYANWIRANTK